jgi:hypothetical protein
MNKHNKISNQFNFEERRKLLSFMIILPGRKRQSLSHCQVKKGGLKVLPH